MSTTALSDLAPERLVNEDDTVGHLKAAQIMDDRRRRTELIIAVVIVLSVAAVVLGVVALARNGHIEVEYEQEFAAPGWPWGSEKIWTFASGHYDVNLEYLDESSGTIKGYNIDIVNAVCKIANKNCVIVEDSSRCVSTKSDGTTLGGEGLLGRWYDACAGWGITKTRSRVFGFTKPYSKLSRVGIYVANTTTNFDWRDLRDVTVGFVSAFSSDARCLANYDDIIQGAGLSDSQTRYFPSLDDLVAAVIDGTVKAAFCYDEPQMAKLRRVTADNFENRCALGGYGMMARKDNSDFFEWWNAAFDKLITTTEYRLICEDLKNAHGHKPGRGSDEVCL
ncbi:uncharacterized protein [Diadema antillarum]|uniref:uncharacterized protein n=1 Tax=Diadema antillarum TaxID=105358 RepID=UPI003A8A38B1